MAKIDFSMGDKYGRALGYWEARMLDDNALKRIVKRGAGFIADALRQAMKELPTSLEKTIWRVRKIPGTYTQRMRIEKGLVTVKASVTEREKELMQEHFGITPIKRDKDGFLHAKLGWDGYTTHAKRGFPKGFPVQFMVAGIESGTSYRARIPFIRRTLIKYEQAAVEEMQKALDEELEDIFNFEGRV